MRSREVHLSRTRSGLQPTQINPSPFHFHTCFFESPSYATAFSCPLLSSTHRALKPNLSGTQEVPGAPRQSRMLASLSGEQGSGWVGTRDNQARQMVDGWVGGWAGAWMSDGWMGEWVGEQVDGFSRSVCVQIGEKRKPRLAEDSHWPVCDGKRRRSWVPGSSRCIALSSRKRVSGPGVPGPS